jgi:arsenate reductase
MNTELIVKNILVVCRTNSFMSPVVESLINARSTGSWRAFSAASEPAERINPYAFRALKETGIALKASRSPVGWHQFCGLNAPRFEIVLTVSEDVAWEEMPVWNGVPRLVHWAMPDPLAIPCSPLERIGLVRAWCDLACARVEAFLLEEREAVHVEPVANDNRGIANRAAGT